MANLITWTALPGGRHDASSARTRLSMFVSLRIEDPPSCADIADWPATLAGLRFRVTVEGGSLPDFSEEAGTLDRVTKVTPSSAAWKLGLGHTMLRPAASSVAGARATAERFADERRLLSFDSQSIVTALENLYAESVRRQAEAMGSEGQRPGVLSSFATASSAQSSLQAFAKQAQLADFIEFYRPVASGVLEHDTTPFDFNQTVALIGQYPHLMRLFGITVDFELDLRPEVLPIEGRIRIEPAAPLGCAASSLWTAFEAFTRDGHVLFTPRAREAALYRHGFLHLGAGSRFGVVQEDIEGQTLKLRSFAQRLSLGRDQPDADASSDLPAQRTVGLTFLHTGRASQLVANTQRSLTTLASAEAAGVSAGVADETLFLEDVCRSVRPDVKLGDGEFRSLCSREVDFRIGEGSSAVRILEVEDEGFVAGTTARPDDQARVHEAIFRFDGYGLCAERPFNAVEEEPLPSSNSKELRIEAVSRAVKGSLHPLRYGAEYRFAVRTVDVSGGGLTLEDTRRLLGGGSPVIEGALGDPIDFVRREPVGSPLVVPTGETGPGESADLIAVRTDQLGSGMGSARHLLPPQVAVEVVERSGVLDGMPARVVFDLLDDRDEQLDREFYSRKHFNEVPYLADPLARRARLEFVGLPDQTEPVVLEVPFQENGWPEANGILLELCPGNKPPRVGRERGPLGLHGRPRVRVDLPPGCTATVFVQSIPDPEDLPATFLAQYGLADNPAHVAHPALAPARRIELVHAVERPLAVPAFTEIRPLPRSATDTFVVLEDRLAVDVKSTGRLTCLARWEEPVDVPAQSPGEESFPPGAERRSGEAFSFPLDPGLEHVLLAEGGKDHLGSVIPNRHHLGTTGHREVEYRLLAETRFPDFFPGSSEKDKRLESSAVVVDVPNAGPPAALSIRNVIPIFDWVAGRRAVGRKGNWPKRRSSRVVSRDRLGRRLRVYVERPCLLSGFREQLGVVLWPAPLTELASEEVSCLRQVVTQWALDPIWRSAPLPEGPFARHFPLAERLFQGIQLVEIPELSQQVDPGTERECSIEEGRLANRVVVAGHSLHFDRSADAWYADVEIDSEEAYFPFVRLALVRFQPISEPGAHASRLAFADFAQLAPDRYLTLTYVQTPRPAVEISLVGPGYEAQPDNRPEAHIVVRLESRILRHTDLGWEQQGDEIVLSCTSLHDGRMAWGGRLSLPRDCRSESRLTVREFERFREPGTGVVRQRLVYADAVSVRP